MKQEIFFKKITKNSINSKESLCRALGISLDDLDYCFHLPKESRYSQPRNISPKRDGSIRNIYNPNTKIREVQKKIKNKILKSNLIIKWPYYVYGVEKKEKNSPPKDFVASAAVHCQSKTILKIDIKDFFDNISEELVVNVFENLYKYPPHISSLLADLCCYDGFLPQGALTSSHLATLILFDTEPEIVKKLSYKKLKYTRYIDDITISSEIHNYDMSYAQKIIEQMLTEKGLFINKNKTFSGTHSLCSLDVHGLLVDSKKPRITAEKKKNIRAAIHQLKLDYSIPNRNSNPGYKKEHERISGRVSLLTRLKHPKAKKYREALKSIPHKPNHYDVKVTISQIKILSENTNKNNLLWYKSFYHKVEYRVNWFRGHKDPFRLSSHEKLSESIRLYKPKNNK